MDAARFWVGVVMLSFDPAAILFWFLVCPFIASWRRAGAKMTLVVHFVGMFVVLVSLIPFAADIQGSHKLRASRLRR